MKLFEFLPQNLFSILSSRNKEIYVEALFVLRKAFKQEMTIRKTDLASMLIASLDEKMYELDLSEEEPEVENSENESEGASLSSRAHFLLRRLKETGWIDVEYQIDSFDENITLPDYSVKLINLLFSFTDENVKEYNSFVYSTYSDLKIADQERDDYMYTALINAYDKTTQLVDELKTLHNNIRRYHQALHEYATINDILKGHFDEYKALIMDRVYHPLKTLDSVPRFKTPIMKILSDWMVDHKLRELMAKQAILRGKYKNMEDANEDIILKIGDISDTYERLEEMLEEIDRKNSAYTRASIEKMRYLLNSDRSIKGKLVDLLMRISISMPENQEILIEQLACAVELFRQGYLDERSLFMRTPKNKKEEGKPLEVLPSLEDDENNALAEFLEKAKLSYSHTRILQFMTSVMNNANVITSQEIPLPDDETFILLMFGTLKGGEKNVFYQVKFGEGYIIKNGYRVPEMKFIRKEHLNNVG
jgi:hypothetical protein